jgi:co-chaperonin GroES (HSP10)
MKEEIKFRLGDRVYAPFHGYGVVTAIHEDACVYPIEVTWDDSGLKNMEDVNTFTADGLLSKYYANTDTILTVVKGSHKRNRRKEMTVSKFKVGDRVYCPCQGYGTVTKIHDDGQEYPIVVTWDEKQHGGDVSIFTPEGAAVKGLNDDADDIVLVKKATPKEVKAMKDNKIKTDAINPPHYRVKGIPEAYDIMTHLMNREQLEGFLWGNIIKYAYRYGRKGDEADTAGKIKWYAQKLKELGECESE